MIKRLLTMLLVVVIALSMVAMAGCGGKGSSGNSGNTGNTGNNSGSKPGNEDEFFMDMPAELKGTTVKFATWIDHTQTDTAAVLAGFEQTTGMKCELIQVPQGDYISKVSGQIASDQAPDVLVDNREFPRTLELLQPLLVETTGLDVTDPFWNQKLIPYYTVGKYTYLVNATKSAWDIAGGCTYFNRTLLEDNGITTPSDYVEQDNWNLNTFYTLMTQIKKSCKTVEHPADVAFDVFTAMYNTREIKYNPDTDRFENTMRSDEMVKALKYLAEAKELGLLQIQYGESSGGFVNGTAAVEICGAYGLRNRPGWFSEMDINDLGVTVLPKITPADADYPYTTFPRAYGIIKGAKNPKGAAYFLRYFLNEDNYDFNNTFKNEECKELYIRIRDNSDYSRINFNRALLCIMKPDAASYEHLSSGAISGGSAQIETNLAKVETTINDGVKRANELLDKCIATQQ